MDEISQVRINGTFSEPRRPPERSGLPIKRPRLDSCRQGRVRSYFAASRLFPALPCQLPAETGSPQPHSKHEKGHA